MDGVQARIPKIANFNNGNVPYELLIRNNTVISNLGKFKPIQIYEDKPIQIKLSEILNATQRVSMFHYIYIKSTPSFRQTYTSESRVSQFSSSCIVLTKPDVYRLFRFGFVTCNRSKK